MPIEKLEEFARDGQKNTDELILTDGFPRPKFPARQWFNYLFNMLSLKINELIDLDPISRSEIIDDLKTNDSKKPLSAAQGKILQDKKLEATDLKDASTTQKGIVQLVNDLTTGGIDKAITAEAVKQFKNAFKSSRSQNGYIEIPCADGVPLIIQWARVDITAYSIVAGGSLPIAFPNGVLNWSGVVANGRTPEIYVDSVVTKTSFTIRSNVTLGTGAVSCNIFAVGY